MTNAVRTSCVQPSAIVVPGLGATDQWSGYSSLDERNLAESTAGSDPSTSLSAKSEKEIIRLSRTPRVLARFITIREIHVLNDERSSNRSIPLRTASQASCTTSSATALFETKTFATGTR